MKKWLMGALLGLAVAQATGVEAAASTGGSTGLIDTPTADVVRPGQFFLGYYHLAERDVFSVGLAAARNLEVSVGGWTRGQGDETAVFNAKYAVRQESVLLPGIAVGVEDIGGRKERASYAVLSKGLPWGLRVHVGYGGGSYDGFFCGMEKSLFPAVPGVFPDTSLLLEYNGRRANYGLRMSLLSGLKLSAGRRDGDAYVGVTYNFY